MATADADYADRCNKLILAFTGEVSRVVLSCASFLNNVEFAATNLEIVVIGPVDSSKTLDLVAAVQSRSLPNKLLVVAPPGQALPEGHPIKDKGMQNGVPTAYICQRGRVSAPITNPVTLSQMLQLPPRPQQQQQGTRLQ
ncbi:MAG: hypothetical protein WDM89_09190 [Rhizomicrobium sp.]